MEIKDKEIWNWLGQNKLAYDIFTKKYRVNNESLNEWLDRVSGGDDKVRQLIKDKKFLFGGRVLANRGVEDAGSEYNCYSSGYVEDSYSAIMDRAKEIGITFKAQGGQGLSLTKLRPKGAPIGKHYHSDGIIPFLKIFNQVTNSTSQGNARRGALLVSLDARHKEAMDFINIKTNLNEINNANLSLEIDDEFMKAVQKYYDTGEVVVLHMKENYSGHDVEWDITPIELYKKMVETNHECGEPGAIFTNRFRNYNFMEFDDRYEIETCNPCCTGDTKILTEKGYVEIEKLVGIQTRVWNGYEYSDVIPKVTGRNQELLKIITSDGCELKCTKYHKFILQNGTRVEAQNLKIGDKLVKCDYPVIEGYDSMTNPYTQGAFSGDGFICKGRNARYISLYDKKKSLRDYLAIISRREQSSLRETYNIDVIYDKDFVPGANYILQDRLQWLAGLCDTDGSVEDGAIQITSINKSFLLNVKFMLNTMGVNPVLSMSHKARMKTIKNSQKEYLSKDCFRITISASDVQKLVSIGFKPHRLNLVYSPNRAAKRFIQIANIEEAGLADTVYCFTEEKNHSGIFGGIITAQCGEQPLKAKTCCNLGSINLYEFVENKFTDKAKFNFKEFEEAVKIACNALDNIIDENASRIPKGLEEYAANAIAWRNIGLGVFNYAGMLMALRLKYGSKEALEFTDKLFYDMLAVSVANNIERGRTFGSFPMFDKDKINKATIFNSFKECNIDAFRNCSLLSIAPTGSLSNLFGIGESSGTGGTEPEFALAYTRRTDNLDSEYKVDSGIVNDYRRITGDTGSLPDYFVSSADISWRDRINTQAVIQKYVDTAISSTVNLPKETTVEEMEQLYLYAWQNGLKGVTVFRDGCARQGILTTGQAEPKPEETLTIRDLPRGCVIKTSDDGLIGKKKTLKVGCGSLHVQAWFDNETGDLLETFFDKGSTGGCMSFMCGLSRQISLAARGGVSVEQIVDQLESTLPCPSYVTRTATKHDTSPGTSCPQAIGRALKSMHKEVLQELGIEDEPVVMPVVKQSDIHDTSNKPKCPECGAELIFEGGCNTCKNCGWSKCG